MTVKRSVSYKLDEEEIRVLNELAAHLGLSQAGVLGISLRLLARREGIPVQGDLERGYDGSLFIPLSLKKRTKKK